MNNAKYFTQEQQRIVRNSILSNIDDKIKSSYESENHFGWIYFNLTRYAVENSIWNIIKNE